MGGWVAGWAGGLVGGCMGGWVAGWVARWAGGWAGGCLAGWLGGQVGGCMGRAVQGGGGKGVVPPPPLAMTLRGTLTPPFNFQRLGPPWEILEPKSPPLTFLTKITPLQKIKSCDLLEKMHLPSKEKCHFSIHLL